ncbi:MAG: ATP-binding protein [Wenzhouxiangellaceae bacterium]
MNRFFRRILLSVWLTMVVGIMLAFFLTRWLPSTEVELANQALVYLVASDLQERIDRNEASPNQRVSERHVLNYEDLLDIYVIDRSTGRDVEGRSLPWPVQEVLERGPNIVASDDRIIQSPFETPGFKVVGFDKRYPLVQAVGRSGGRPVVLLTMLTVSAVVSYFLARFIVLPIRHLREAGHRVAAGDLSVRVAHTVGDRQDDIARLARDFDTMTERIGRLLSTQQRLMRDVSHELRSPLARLQALQSLARQSFTDADHMRIVDRMDIESERLNDLIERILAFARLDAQQEICHQFTDLADLVRTIIDDVHIELGDDDIMVRQSGPERLTLDADASLLHSAIENIIRNAVRFTPKGSVVQVTLTASPMAVRVVVDDEGPGVPDDALPQLFDPFFLVDESRPNGDGGSGVGLAIARRAAQLHGGSIAAENLAERGLRVTMELPAVAR